MSSELSERQQHKIHDLSSTKPPLLSFSSEAYLAHLLCALVPFKKVRGGKSIRYTKIYITDQQTISRPYPSETKRLSPTNNSILITRPLENRNKAVFEQR